MSSFIKDRKPLLAICLLLGITGVAICCFSITLREYFKYEENKDWLNRNIKIEIEKKSEINKSSVHNYSNCSELSDKDTSRKIPKFHFQLEMNQLQKSKETGIDINSNDVREIGDKENLDNHQEFKIKRAENVNKSNARIDNEELKRE